MNGRFALALIAVIAVSSMTGCTTNPMTGRSQFMIVSENAAISRSANAYTSMIGNLDNKGKIIYSGPEVDRVKAITDRLITQAVLYRPDAKQWNWTVKVIDEPNTVNAFCMAGGKMAVYTGLLEKIKPTDDELAQVMGHEISHALAGHSAEKMSVQLVTNIAVAAIAAAGNSRNQQARHDAANYAALVFVNLPNSRQAETEADKLGIELAARAGFQPHAAVTLWAKMARESGGSSRFDFLNTHPAPPKRLEALAALEPPMQKIYAESGANQVKTREWTKLASNVRYVDEGNSGSANPTVSSLTSTPLAFYSENFEQFKDGKLVLNCKGECYTQYLIAQSGLKKLYEDKSWRELAQNVIKLSYKFDLSYYYLGAAAEGMGYTDSARIYYEKASELSNATEDSCSKALLLSCGGIQIPKTYQAPVNLPQQARTDTSAIPMVTADVPIETIKSSAGSNYAQQPVVGINKIDGIGLLEYEAEKLAMTSGCQGSDGVRPTASLIERSSTLEVYKIGCVNKELKVRCEYHKCLLSE